MTAKNNRSVAKAGQPLYQGAQGPYRTVTTIVDIAVTGTVATTDTLDLFDLVAGESVGMSFVKVLTAGTATSTITIKSGASGTTVVSAIAADATANTITVSNTLGVPVAAADTVRMSVGTANLAAGKYAVTCYILAPANMV